MSLDPNAPEPYAAQTPPRKVGGSTIWMVLGIGCGLVLLLCCGGGVAMFYVGRNAMNFTQDPGQIAQRAGEIADLDVPDGFKPEMAMSMQVPFSGQRIMTMVGYSAPNQEGGLFLAEAGQFAGADPEQMRAQMESSMQQQGRQVKQLRVIESREVEVEIRGKPATFRIQKAEDTQSKQEYVQVQGSFEGKGGPAVLVGQLKSGDFTEDDAEKLVRSIK